MARHKKKKDYITINTSKIMKWTFGILALLIFGIFSGWVALNFFGSDPNLDATPVQVNQGTVVQAIQVRTEPIQESKIDIVKRIVEEYHRTHTYSLPDFYVCGNMASDVWNELKTEGINAKLKVGNVGEDLSRISGMDAFRKINHVWVMAETEPFKYLAVEATGGYVVWTEDGVYTIKEDGVYATNDVKNNLYYAAGFTFDNPGEFSRFSTLRDNFFKVCGEADYLQSYWNSNIAGRYSMTTEIAEYKGKMDAKVQECKDISIELKGLLQ